MWGLQFAIEIALGNDRHHGGAAHPIAGTIWSLRESNSMVSSLLVMKIHIQLLPGAVFEILVAARDSGALSRADRYGLLAAVLDESLDEEARWSVDRLLRSVHRGRVGISDRISTIL